MRIVLFLIIVTLAGCGGKTPVAELYNAEASMPAGLDFNPLEWKVISSSINTRYHTMSTLYGNDSAVQCARSKPFHVYSTASVLVLVTWQQKEDPHWFGARLPAAVKCVERVSFIDTQNSIFRSAYEKFEGNPLKISVGGSADSIQRRITFIVNQRPSVMP